LPQERKKIFGQEDHVRIYGQDYFKRLEQSGFIVIKDDFINNLNRTEKERLVLDKNEIIFFCTKQAN